MFSSAQNFVVSNSQLIDQHIDVGATGIDILLEASSPHAAYDSSARNSSPQCHPGTRVQYIEDIIDWATPTVNVGVLLPLFWMKGPAGVGKSAIAQTCVEKLQNLGKLGAAFFFSANGCDKAAQIFPTIAYQLSTEFPDYRSLVNQRIRHDKTIVNKTMAAQFRSLIAEPFQELRGRGKDVRKRIPIFIDGLGECESVDAQCEIIEIIAAASRDGLTPLCWAFFSRPESHIEATFSAADVAQVTCTVLLPISRDADSEIELYLRSGFKKILRRRNISMQSQWPSSEDLRALVQNTGGLFVYAAMALRVVAQPGFLPEESLRAILATGPDRGDTPASNNAPKSPFAELDTFYTLIMQRIPPEMLPTILLLCAVLCFSGRYPGTFRFGVLTQSNVLALSESQFKIVCSQLSAVLFFRHQPESLVYTAVNTSRPFYRESPAVTQELRGVVLFELGGSVSFHHKSFYDFLIDPMRSGKFCVTSPTVYNALFKHCLELQRKYQESYCVQGLELTLAPDVPDSASSLSYPYGNDELINSIVKARVLGLLHETCLDLTLSSEIDTELLEKFQDVDFRKSLSLKISLFPQTLDLVMTWWGRYASYARMGHGIQLLQLLPYEFSRFDAVGFQKMVKRMQGAGIVRPYHRSFSSRFKSLFQRGSRERGSRDRFISGLYCMGRGPMSYFWYWEVDFDAGYYREVRAINLADGERMFREESFDLWPEEWQWQRDRCGF